MKKLIFAVALTALTLGGMTNALAQTTNTNAQLHYIWGNHMYKDLKDRHELLVTVEHTSFDKWGMNFGFVDLMMGANGMKSAYTELVRELKFWEAPISAHIEYNGGLSSMGSFNNVYLFGPSYAYVNSKNGLTLSATAMYRHDQKMEKPHNFQFTTTWGWTSWNRLWTLCGFMDIWTNSMANRSHVVFLTQPQVWFNLNQVVGVSDSFNLSLGTEIQISYNYIAPDKFYIQPTAGIKWTF